MASLEHLVEKEVLPVLKDIADSLRKLANPAYVVHGTGVKFEGLPPGHPDYTPTPKDHRK